MHAVGIEIERKFLVAGKPPLAPGAGARVEQGYLVVADDVEVRLRRMDERFFLTVKRGTGLTRAEHEVALTAEQFDALWPATEGRRLQKRRFEVALEGLTAEVDVYDGVLAGLVVAEVEFPTENGALGFTPPSWFGPEVTEDRRYGNRALATASEPPR